ncbi:hypothetical protein B0H13DRAFT_2341092 [Mycena leptocephala]|nr:hypothetical protein B0H13DRAFT_2341092 [Mycena leptocephala]
MTTLYSTSAYEEPERTIFRIATLPRPTSIPKLMLIAWRVKHRVEPLLYHALSVFTPDLRRKTIGFHSYLHGSLRRLTVNAEKLLAGYAHDEAHPAFHATTATQLSTTIRYYASPAYRISGT